MYLTRRRRQEQQLKSKLAPTRSIQILLLLSALLLLWTTTNIAQLSQAIIVVSSLYMTGTAIATTTTAAFSTGNKGAGEELSQRSLNQNIYRSNRKRQHPSFPGLGGFRNTHATQLYESSSSSNSDHDDSVNEAPLTTMTKNQNDVNRNNLNSQQNESKTTSNAAGTVERKTWNPLRLAVLRLGMTEPAMTSPLNYGKYDDNDSDDKVDVDQATIPKSTFHCAYCHAPLFPAYAKYNSGTGWPSFWRTYNTTSITYVREWDGRVECTCSKCKSHLGHVFMDGPLPSQIEPAKQGYVSSAPSTDLRSSSSQRLPRYCMNGLALIYSKRIGK